MQLLQAASGRSQRSSGYKTLLSLAGLLALMVSSNAQAIVGAPCNGTVMDFLANNPETQYTKSWVDTVGFTAALSSPLVNLTLFAPIDSALERMLPIYTGRPFNLDKEVQDSIAVALYHSAQGNYTEQELKTMDGVNTLLGLLKYQDFMIGTSSDENGELVLTGIGGQPNNTARIISRTQACNGQFYVVDNLLLPANNVNEIDSTYGDSILLAKIFLNSSKCETPLPKALRSVPGAALASDIWTRNGLEPLLNSSTLSATVLLPRGEHLNGQGRTDTTRIALYNMIPGQFCPEELAAAGQKNSMLGEIQGTQLPLRFSREANGTVIVEGDAGTRTRILEVINDCKYVILVTDDILMPNVTAGGAAFAFIPQELPTLPDRQVVCNSTAYKSIIPGSNSSQSISPSTDDSSNQGDADSSKSSNTGLIVGVAVGAVAAATLVAAAGVFAVRRRRLKTSLASGDNKFTSVDNTQAYSRHSGALEPEALSKKLSQILQDGGIASGSGSTSSASNSNYQSRTMSVNNQLPLSLFAPPSNVFGYDSTRGSRGDTNTGSTDVPATLEASPPLDLGPWEVSADDLSLDLNPDGSPVVLGKGSFGIVYRGMLRGVQPAAIKMIMRLGRAAEAAFIQEASILQHISRDKNVVQLYGVAKLPDRLVIVTELMNGGDLRDALSETGPSEEFSWHRRGKWIALDVARGLIAMHASNVIHRDVKSVNVLLSSRDNTCVAKLGDVGIASMLTHSYLTPTGGMIGTLAWTAPEMIIGTKCSEKVDIYSYGVLCWELATGCVPRRGFIEPPPVDDEKCPQGLVDLISDCTEVDPNLRPTAKQVYERILKIAPYEEV